MFTKSYGYSKAICFLLLLLVSSSIFAQTRITGKVTNGADNQPIVGATVQEKGTTNATQTNNEGAFTITAANNSSLVITVVGYASQEVAVNGRSNISVGL